jgi:hypothetical protein
MLIQSSKTSSSAHTLKNKVESHAEQARQQDNTAADLNSETGRVVLSADHQTVDLDPSQRDHLDVLSADLKYEGDKFESGSLQVSDYYISGYGKSAEDNITFSKEKVQERTGFLGIFGPKESREVYTRKVDDYWNTNNVKETAKFNQAGEVVDYARKEYAMTFGEATKEILTTPAGLGLTAVAAALGGVPGSLGHVLMGPAGALVTGSLAVAGLAYAKTRAW